MTATAASNNVIQFPLEKRKPDKPPSEDMGREMSERKREFVDKLIDDWGSQIYRKIQLHGFPVESQDFIAQYSYVLESLRSCLYWSVEEDHPFTPHIKDIIEQFAEDTNAIFEDEDPDPASQLFTFV